MAILPGWLACCSPTLAGIVFDQIMAWRVAASAFAIGVVLVPGAGAVPCSGHAEYRYYADRGKMDASIRRRYLIR